MKIITAIIFLSILTLTIFGQNKLRTAEELINRTDPGWPFVQQLIDSATNSVEVLPVDSTKNIAALVHTQVTTRSPMGAIIYQTGGILIDNGWIRILGSGSEKLNRSLPDWNKGKSFKKFGEQPSFLLIADDAIGGFFAVNGGAFGKDAGKVYYLSPDRLVWEPLDLTYTNFLSFCFSGDLKSFYEHLRWSTWKEDVSKLDANMVYNFYPFLWTKEGKDINKVSKKAVPIEEQYLFNLKSRK